MTDATGHEEAQKDLTNLMAVSNRRGFKLARLSPLLFWTGVVALLASAVSLGWAAWNARPDILTPTVIFMAMLICLLGPPLVLRLMRFPKSWTQMFIGLLLIPGAAVAWLHIALFDPLYLAWGKLGPTAANARSKARARLLIAILVSAGALAWMMMR